MISACNLLHGAVVKDLPGTWSSPLDDDLRTAVADKEVFFTGKHIELRWAAVLPAQSDYNIERGATGVPLRKAARVVFAFYYPARNKCFLSAQMNPPYDDQLIRENVGGDHYGPPRLVTEDPLAGDRPVGSEVLCSAVRRAEGGIHVHADSVWPDEAAPTQASR